MESEYMLTYFMWQWAVQWAIVSAFRQLKMYIRSTIDKEQLTGLALRNVHSNDTEEIDTFTKKDKVDDMD